MPNENSHLSQARLAKIPPRLRGRLGERPQSVSQPRAQDLNVQNSSNSSFNEHRRAINASSPLLPTPTPNQTDRQASLAGAATHAGTSNRQAATTRRPTQTVHNRQQRHGEIHDRRFGNPTLADYYMLSHQYIIFSIKLNCLLCSVVLIFSHIPSPYILAIKISLFICKNK